MNARRRSFIRKILYGACLLPLVSMLFWLGRPATLARETVEASPGGVLARARRDGGLEQVYLGEIDPTSETLKLATLGMRGIAANILWTKGIEYQKKKDWTNLSATLNQITKLQPNFIDVWRHQGWNLSYNCSAEFDDYRDRYRWVIKGIRFLQQGATYNETEPRLLRDIGWYIAHKIGRSDETKQFRQLFKDDDDFHGARSKDQRDNWLVGKLWFRKAEALIDRPKNAAEGAAATTRGMNAVVFRSEGPMCAMNYAAALEKDGVFGERAWQAWQQATKDWADFGKFGLPGPEGRMIRLGEYDRLQKEQKKKFDELKKLAPGVYEKLYEERVARLTEEQREAREASHRTPEQETLAAEANELVRVLPYEILRNPGLPRENRAAANKVYQEYEGIGKQLRLTESYRGIVNYEYWRRRAEIEQEREMLTARELVYQGSLALAKGDLPGALGAFARGSESWARVLDRYPMMLRDRATTDDIEDLLLEYGKALDQDNSLFPTDFALSRCVQYLVRDNAKMYLLRVNTQKAAEAQAAGEWGEAAAFLEKAFQNWRGILVDLPSLEQRSDPMTVESLLGTIRQYAAVMKKLDRPIPSDFPLHQFVRVQMEHDPETAEVQPALDRAEAAGERSDWAATRQGYEDTFAIWRRLLDRYPTLIADSTWGEEVVAAIEQYREVLKRRGAEMSKDFELKDVLDRYGRP